jgi:hypothetical protein
MFESHVFLLVAGFVLSATAIEVFHKPPKLLKYTYKTTWFDQKAST